MRLLAPPGASTDSPGGGASLARGKAAFAATGCALCHTPTLRTGNATVSALRNRLINLLRRLLLHDMGSGLADGVAQGQAGPRDFRTAPLWILGQRLLPPARRPHAAICARPCGTQEQRLRGQWRDLSFQSLSDNEQQDLFNFLPKSV